MKRNIKAKVRRLAAIAAALALAVAIIPAQEAEAATNMSLDSSTLYLEAGDSATLNSNYGDTTWTVTDENVAKVYPITMWDKTARTVKAVSPGRAVVKASGQGTARCTVTVIGISESDFSLSVGRTCKLKFYGNSLYAVKWRSEDESVAKVNKSGKVTGVGVGTTEIVAKCRGKEYTATVTVEGPWLNATRIEMLVGEERTLMAMCAEGGCAWASRDDAVASVAGSGDSASVTVTGESAGSTTVTCDVDGMALTCEVEVVESWGTDEDGNELKRVVLFDLAPYPNNVIKKEGIGADGQQTYTLATYIEPEDTSSIAGFGSITFISPTGEKISGEDIETVEECDLRSGTVYTYWYDVGNTELGAWSMEYCLKSGEPVYYYLYDIYNDLLADGCSSSNAFNYICWFVN